MTWRRVFAVDRIGRQATMSGGKVVLFVMAADAQAPTKYGANGTFDSFDDAIEDATPLIDGSLRDR